MAVAWQAELLRVARLERSAAMERERQSMVRQWPSERSVLYGTAMQPSTRGNPPAVTFIIEPAAAAKGPPITSYSTAPPAPVASTTGAAAVAAGGPASLTTDTALLVVPTPSRYVTEAAAAGAAAAEAPAPVASAGPAAATVAVRTRGAAAAVATATGSRDDNGNDVDEDAATGVARPDSASHVTMSVPIADNAATAATVAADEQPRACGAVPVVAATSLANGTAAVAVLTPR